VSLKPEVWSAIFAGISALVLIVGITIVLVNLRIIAKEQRLVPFPVSEFRVLHIL
jgi:hypothetical protein